MGFMTGVAKDGSLAPSKAKPKGVMFSVSREQFLEDHELTLCSCGGYASIEDGIFPFSTNAAYHRDPSTSRSLSYQ